MNTKAKGSRAEHRAMKMLESTGFRCTRAAASLGAFDVIAIGHTMIRLVQVKAGTKYASALEREAMQTFPAPSNCQKEIWRFPDGARFPSIEVL